MPTYDITNDDCVMFDRFRAHADMCNGITFIPDLNIIATCGFDCNVYMFDADSFKRVGSLLMGTGQAASAE
jgi:hypothetical protein